MSNIALFLRSAASLRIHYESNKREVQAIYSDF